MTSATGMPTRIGFSARLAAMLIGVTVPPPPTWAVWRPGVNAMVIAPPLTRIGLPGVLVAVLIGVSVLSVQAT